ncbi:46 kDa FK506-binding nuclear protein [Cylas formicarius]|uniref:46 kDa FK506-binding nuclear protein n=1 Tax=Cylas formicarius TaxID=197179 RepID=UPI0029586B75|nr:46 kDa FK506-binding nuclear protein [Cylas formicarius]
MFWGLIMEPERRYSQKVKKQFHISKAALDISTSGDEPSQVMCGYEGRNYLLCTLRKPDVLQCDLDLEFAEGSEVSFATNGKAHIHLTGYLTNLDSELSFGDLEEQEEEEVENDDSDEEQVEEKSVPVKKKKNKIDRVENGPPSKKPKINGVPEDSDEDDSDYEGVDEETEGADFEDSDEDDESGEEEDEDSEEEVQENVKPKAAKNQQQNGDKKKENKKVDLQVKLKKEPSKKQIKLEKGVIVEDLKIGDGAVAKSGKLVTVYYEGRLEKNNKLFDSSNKGAGFKFRLGANEVIKGWDIGVIGMKVGGKRKIICPPNTAYGVKGSPPAIPSNSTLVFTVELKKVT